MQNKRSNKVGQIWVGTCNMISEYIMSFEPNMEYNHNVTSQTLCAQIYYIFIFSDITDIVCF